MKNKITPQDIADTVKEEVYFNTGKTTICVLKLRNGFEVVGTAGAVDPANFDLEIGKSISKKNAIDKIWELEGYLLQENIFGYGEDQ